MDVVGGPFSSARAELVGICMGMTSISYSAPAALFVNSSAATQRLQCFCGIDFQLAFNKVQDLDVFDPILECLCQLQNAGATTVIVQVHGHWSDPLHTHADTLAVEGANKEWEEDEQPLFPAPRSDWCLFSGPLRRDARESGMGQSCQTAD